jgi:hypothetical protein
LLLKYPNKPLKEAAMAGPNFMNLQPKSEHELKEAAAAAKRNKRWNVLLGVGVLLAVLLTVVSYGRKKAAEGNNPPVVTAPDSAGK